MASFAPDNFNIVNPAPYDTTLTCGRY